MNNNFISENGIVAVLGDEDQLVTVGITRTNNPLSNEKGRIGQIRDNDAYCREVVFSGSIIFNFRPLLNS